MRDPTNSPIRAALMFEEPSMSDLNAIIAPGMLARNPERPEWGTGQVQSNIEGRITVNFREEGKVVIDGAHVALLPVFDEG